MERKQKMTLIKEYLKSKSLNMKKFWGEWGGDVKFLGEFIIVMLLQTTPLSVILFSLEPNIVLAPLYGLAFAFCFTFIEWLFWDDYKTFKSYYKPPHKKEGETK